MRKSELARAVARKRHRPAATRAAARVCRAQLARVADAPSERLAAIPALLLRAGANGRMDGWSVAALAAALARVRWTERIALPLAAVALAGVVGAAMPLLIAAGTTEGVAVPATAAPIPASQVSPDLGESDRLPAAAAGPTRDRSTERPQTSAPLADGEASSTAVRTAAVLPTQDSGQPSAAQADSSQGGASGPSTDPAPQAPTGPEAEEPAPEPPVAPTPGPPVDEEPEGGEAPGAKTTLCHNAGSQNPKTIVVGAESVEEHLAHGDTLGVCP